MDIKLNPKDKAEGDAFYFASLPEVIQGVMDAKMQSFDIISQGTVKIPKGTGAKELSWSGVFFGESRRNMPFIKTKYWKNPKSCVETLENWMSKGTVLNIVISGTWINMDVTISSFQVEEFGAYGDIRYTLKLVQKKPLMIYTTKELKIAAFVKKTKPRASSSGGGSKGNYTVVSGDTLWGIASKKCGGGTNWTKLYDANAGTIEATAKAHGKSSSDHGHWIWPGETLVLV